MLRPWLGSVSVTLIQSASPRRKVTVRRVARAAASNGVLASIVCVDTTSSSSISSTRYRFKCAPVATVNHRVVNSSLPSGTILAQAN